MTDPAAAKVDVVILGAGVNGAGLFRDLCEQGVACLLVDTADYGGGTSAAPSRLIHGGLKYLETGEFGLVAQSTLERNLLLQNAPHLVRPLATVIPIFSWTKGIGAALRTFLGAKSAPRSRGAVLVGIGLALYDLYGRRHRVMPRHRMWSRSRALHTLPALTPRIVAAGTYYDAYVTAPERLVWELVRDGLSAHPASRSMTYTTLLGQRDGTLTLRGENGQEMRVTPRLVVNAAGPWIDRVNATLGAPSHLIGGTKGSHILLEHDALIRQLDGRMIYFEADDGRICLVYDYLGRAMVGSTDIPAGDPDTVHCEDDEIDYFIAALSALLPGLRFDRDQIVYAYSGIRPLPNSKGIAPGLISRDHSAPVAEPADDRPFPILSLVGGKWTTFRGFAEEVADNVLGRLDRARRISTQDLPIGGGRDFPGITERKAWVEAQTVPTGLDSDRIATLLDRYGGTAAHIARHEARGDATRLDGDPTTSLAEIDWIARNEDVRHLSDIVLRRTTLAVTGRLTRADLAAIAEVAAGCLNWSDQTRDAEVAELTQILRTRNLMAL